MCQSMLTLAEQAKSNHRSAMTTIDEQSSELNGAFRGAARET
jgi:hypothetical protein